MGLCHCVSFDITMSPLSRGEWYVAVRPILPKASAGMRSARQIGQSPEVVTHYRSLGLRWVKLAQKERAGLHSWFRRQPKAIEGARAGP